MRTRTLIAALLTLLLASCAHHHPGSGWRHPWTPDPARPQVFVIDGKAVVVSPEPLTFSVGGGEIVIVWHLPRGASYRFPDNGIVIEGRQEEIVRCAPRNEGLEFSCVNRRTQPGKFKYTIRVQDGSKPLKPLDPTIENYL